MRVEPASLSATISRHAFVKVTTVVCAWRDCPPANGDLRHEGAPLRQRGRASLFVDLPCDEMALLIEIVVDLGVN